MIREFRIKEQRKVGSPSTWMVQERIGGHFQIVRFGNGTVARFTSEYYAKQVMDRLQEIK